MAADDARTTGGGTRGAPKGRLWVVAGVVVGFVLGLLLLGGDGRSAVTSVLLAVLPAMVGGGIGYYAARGRRRVP